MKTPTTRQLARIMLQSGTPERLAIRDTRLFGIVIEGPDFLPIGGAFKTLEAAHAAHSKAWHAAWDTIP